MKVPLIIGSLVWSAASYFDQSKQLIDESFLSNSTSLFDQDVFTDLPNF